MKLSYSHDFQATATPNIYKHKPTSCYCFYAQLAAMWAMCGLSLALCLYDSIDAAKQAEDTFYHVNFRKGAQHAH